MRSTNATGRAVAAGMAICAQLALCSFAFAQPAVPAAPAAAQQPPGRGAVDPRVEQRTYTFADTNEQMPYALFVSSKVTKDAKSPLIVSLHGLGGDQNTMVREGLRSVELAEQGGYILVAPMGYNSAGWYGIPPGPPRPAPANANGPQRAPRPVIGGTAITDPAKVREASERDVMAVLDLVRKEFNVDERRIYLMGHSMGGAGTYYLGSKHGNVWAALAPIAPAAMGMTNDRVNVLEGIKAAGVPMLVTMGDADEAVPVANVRTWVETMKELGMNHEYKEFPGVTHGPIIAGSMDDIYAFFAKHSKPAVH